METPAFDKKEKIEFFILDFLHSIEHMRNTDPYVYSKIAETSVARQHKAQNTLAGLAFSFMFTLRHLQGSYPDLYWTGVDHLLQILAKND